MDVSLAISGRFSCLINSLTQTYNVNILTKIITPESLVL